MYIRIFLLVATISVFSPYAVASGQTDSGVRASYSGSPDLPDGVAFHSFLITVKSGGPALDELVALALGIPLGDRSQALINKRISFFKEAYVDLQQENDRVARQMLCTQERNSRSDEETYELLNAIDDARGAIREKHFIVVTSKLPTKEQKAFRHFLQDSQQGIGYTITDSRTLYEAGYRDVKNDVDLRCHDLLDKAK